MQWSWGLDGNHDRGSLDAGPRACSRRRSTCSPTWASSRRRCRPGSSPATALDRHDRADLADHRRRPTARTSRPAARSTITRHRQRTSGGGVVGGVEVSVDGGATWHPAHGPRRLDLLAGRRARPARVTIQAARVDDSGNLETPGAGVTVDVGAADLPLLDLGRRRSPAPTADGDPSAVELGVKFRSDVDGLHHRRSASTRARQHRHARRAPLDERRQPARRRRPSRGETAVRLAGGHLRRRRSRSTPNTTYVASYHTPTGYYAFSDNYFASGGVRQRAAARAGRRRRRAERRLPLRRRRVPDATRSRRATTGSTSSSTTDGRDPTRRRRRSTQRSPANGATGVATRRQRHRDVQRADGRRDRSTARPSSCATRRTRWSRRPSRYDAGTRTATLIPNARARTSTTYTATVKGGAGGVKDAAGQRAGRRLHLVVHDGRAAAAAAGRGAGRADPGDRDAANPFSRYYAEILRAEGLNAFTRDRHLARSTPPMLARYDVVILGEMPLSARAGDDVRRLGARRAAT